jgi:hypothetical protein
MKLITKTSLYYLLLSIPILILSGFICFHILTHKVRHANDEVLVNRIKLIEQYLVENDTVSLQFLVKTKEAEINKTLKNNFSNGNKTIFSDTLILDEAENEMDPNRMVSSIVRVKNANYLIKIWRSSIENEELIKGILFLLIFGFQKKCGNRFILRSPTWRNLELVITKYHHLRIQPLKNLQL